MVDVLHRRNLPPDAEPWGRDIENLALGTQSQVEILSQGVQGQNRNTASSLASLGKTILSLQATIASMPITQTVGQRVTGFALSSAWTDVASVTVPAPPGRTTASVFCVGNAGAFDMTTGGLTTSYARLVTSYGTVGPEFPAAKDAGVSQVLNVLSATLTETTSLPDRTVTATLQLRGLNGAAFPANPANFAQISLLVSFL